MSKQQKAAKLAELLSADPFFEEARRLAAETTGLRIGVIYLPRHSQPMSAIDCSSSGSDKFCDLVRSVPELLGRCDASDEAGAKLCTQKDCAIRYRCHAGLIEVISPVMSEGQLVAAVNCGQVHVNRPVRADFARAWKALSGHGLSRTTLERAYMKMPVVSEDQLSTVARIIALTAEHLATSLRVTAENVAGNIQEEPFERYISYCVDLINMIESGRSDHEVLTGLDHLAARLAGQGQPNPQAVAGAVEYFVENYSRNPSLTEAARRTGLATYYLSRLFKKSVGLSPSAFLRELRMRRAKELLSGGLRPIAKIASRVGYLDPAYFCRHFSARFGQAPSRPLKNGLLEQEKGESREESVEVGR